MGKDNVSVKEGFVVEALPNTMFRVELEEDKRVVLCILSGKMRMYRIRVMPGDKAKIELSDYDHTKGRITFRYK